MFQVAETEKIITGVFGAAQELPCPLQISHSSGQAMVEKEVLTSSPTEQSLESVTDHKFIVKQTFRTWEKLAKNDSAKAVENLPSVLFSIQVLLGSEQAFVSWKFTRFIAV